MLIVDIKFHIAVKTYPHCAYYPAQTAYKEPCNYRHPIIGTKAKECIENKPAVDTSYKKLKANLNEIAQLNHS